MTKKTLKAKHRLHASKVDRIAVVDRPAVPDAQIVAFKSISGEGDLSVEKRVVPYQNLDLADRDVAWSSSSAVRRVRKWAEKTDGEIDMVKYRKAFFWYDENNAENLTAYKLPYADVIDGQLKAVPRAVIAVLGVLAGARGGVAIPMADKTKILNQVKKYYAKMDLEFPEVTLKSVEDCFEKSNSISGFMRSFIYRGTRGAINALQDLVWESIYSDGTDVNKEISNAFDEFENIVINFMTKLITQTKSIDVEKKFTKQDTLNRFSRGLKSSALSEMFLYFEHTMPFIILALDELETPDETIKQMIKIFKEQIIQYSAEIVELKFFTEEDGEIYQVVEKAGRILSKARLSKIKDAVETLTAIVQEAEERTQNKSQENIDMDIVELGKSVEGLTASITELKDSIPGVVTGILEQNGLIVTDEKKKEIEAQKAAELEAQKKAEEEAEATRQAELQKAESEKEGQINGRFDKIEATLKTQGEAFTKMNATLDVINARFGVSKSIPNDAPAQNGEPEEDVFGKALRGIPLNKGK